MNKIKNIENYSFENYSSDDISIDVTVNSGDVWLSQSQMSKLFKRNVSTIYRHVNNAFLEELERNNETERSISIEGSDKPVKYYNLDVILSVGYRVKSREGVKFRKWANNILKDYIVKGYAVDFSRLEELEKINIENSKLIIDLYDEREKNNNKILALKNILDYTGKLSMDTSYEDAKEILNVIREYNDALNTLDKYDHQSIEKPVGCEFSSEVITYEGCLKIISALHYKNNEGQELFAVERNRENNGGLKEIIATVYQTFAGEDLYKSLEEKAAVFLYLIVKNHTFVDGNKRIGATLFIYFLQYYDILYKDGVEVIDNDTLVALTLLIAGSNPREKDIIIDIIMNFLMK